MITVAVLGTGKVGSALSRALASGGLDVVQLSSRGTDRAGARAADLVVLAVGDDAIGPVADDLAAEWGPAETARDHGVVHCSGALDRTPLEPLARNGWRTGAWHPMQAFASPDSPVLPGVTWGTTADPALLPLLHDLTTALAGHLLLLRAEDRPRYHAAAAIASNYTDVLVHHAALLLEDCGLAREEALHALLPLVRTSLDGLERAGLPDGLTGPLARGDLGTVRRHLAALADRPVTARLYREAGLAAEPLLAERGMDGPTRQAIDSVLRNPDTFVEGRGA